MEKKDHWLASLIENREKIQEGGERLGVCMWECGGWMCAFAKGVV